jgi:prepilin peptidase CpaA
MMANFDMGLFFLLIIASIATVSDLRSFKIPNWLTYPAIAGGISYFTFMQGYDGFFSSLAGTATGIALLLGPYLFGGTGAGDVKLMGGIGSFLGAKGVAVVFLISCIVGGFYALFLLTSTGLLFGTFMRYGRILKGLFLTGQFVYIQPDKNEREIKVRFGLAISLATGSYLFLGNFIS